VGAGAGAALGEAVGNSGDGGSGRQYRTGGRRGDYHGYNDHPSCNGKKKGHHKHGKYNKHGC